MFVTTSGDVKGVMVTMPRRRPNIGRGTAIILPWHSDPYGIGIHRFTDDPLTSKDTATGSTANGSGAAWRLDPGIAACRPSGQPIALE